MGACFGVGDTNNHRNEIVKAKGPTEQDLVVARLKNMRDELKGRQKQLNMSEEKADLENKKHLADNRRDRAAFALKRKKLFTEYIKEVDDKYIWAQRAILEVERAMQDKNLNEVMKQTNSLLKDIEKGIDLNQYSDMADNIAEADQRRDEFNNLFATYNVGMEEEINNDLKRYEAEVMKSEFEKIDEMNPKFQYKPAQQAQAQAQTQPVQQEKEKDELQARLEALI